MKLLSNDKLSFGPFKPIVLRGSPKENASSVFHSEVILSLSKPEKIANIVVSFKSTSITFWPEGIGARASTTSYEKQLALQSLDLIKEKTQLQPGIHKFPFTFIIPNSYIDTIDDEFGRVKHTVEAVITRTGKSILNQYRTSKSVLILRTYMSNSLLVNNSIQDLSQTFERHFTSGDIEVVVEASAFSPGDIFYMNIIVQPQRKHCRLEHIGCSVTESRKYSVTEMGAWRTSSGTFPLLFASATPLSTLMGSSSSFIEEDDMISIFDKQQSGIELMDLFAYRIGFATPTCKDNFHHTSYYNEILFKHRLKIHVTLSYLNEEKQIYSTSSLLNDHQPPININHDNDDFTEGFHSSPSSPSSPPLTAPSSPSWQTVFSKLRKGKLNNIKNNEEEDNRIYEKMDVEIPMIIFDCRLKEDYGHLPSYFETGIVKPSFTTTMPIHIQSSTSSIENDKKNELQDNSNDYYYYYNNNDSKKKKKEEEKKPKSIPYAYLCDCYYEFCKLMEIDANHHHHHHNTLLEPSLEKIPSIPPPDYID
ncbi:unnamed protein product [Cunninghamella blakesleeana]